MEFISLSKERELDPAMMELIISHMPNELGGVEKGFLNSLGWYVIHSVIPIGNDFKAKLDPTPEIIKQETNHVAA